MARRVRIGGKPTVRSLILLPVLAAWLCLAVTVSAQSDAHSAPASDQPSDQTPAGPVLQASDYAPVVCDPATSGFRFVEVRGSGFDAWATQRLVGNLLDGNGVAQAQWGSVWVSPRGGLTLEVNLCADPFRGRPALAAGTYTVAVGQGSGAAIAATSIDVALPPEPPAEGDLPASARPARTRVNPQPTPNTFVLPNVASAPVPTPLTLVAPAPTPTPGPRNGPGSRQQP